MGDLRETRNCFSRYFRGIAGKDEVGFHLWIDQIYEEYTFTSSHTLPTYFDDDRVKGRKVLFAMLLLQPVQAQFLLLDFVISSFQLSAFCLLRVWNRLQGLFLQLRVQCSTCTDWSSCNTRLCQSYSLFESHCVYSGHRIHMVIQYNPPWQPSLTTPDFALINHFDDLRFSAIAEVQDLLSYAVSVLKDRSVSLPSVFIY